VFFGDPVCPYSPYSVASQWYSNQPSQAAATPVTVTAGHTATGIDAALQRRPDLRHGDRPGAC
jgi:hypothetical protein